jgi:hypothetical protein
MIVPRLGHLRLLLIFSNSSFIYHTVRRYVIYIPAVSVSNPAEKSSLLSGMDMGRCPSY